MENSEPVEKAVEILGGCVSHSLYHRTRVYHSTLLRYGLSSAFLALGRAVYLCAYGVVCCPVGTCSRFRAISGSCQQNGPRTAVP